MYQSKIKVKLTDIVDIETEEDPRHMSREGLQEIITENLADKISLYDHDDLKGIIDSTNILETKTDATEYEGSARICAHDVTYRFWGDSEIPDAVKSALDEEAEKRAQEGITQNFVRGELNYEDENISLTGWWEILSTLATKD